MTKSHRTINVQDQIESCVIQNYLNDKGLLYIICKDEKIIIPQHRKVVEKGIRRRIKKGDIINKNINTDTILISIEKSQFMMIIDK